MNLSVSNIAWGKSDDRSALELLARLGVHCLELAPTRWWPDLAAVGDRQIAEVQNEWRPFGIRAVAFQAVLFGKPDLSVFDPATREPCLRYLESVVHLASRMEVSAIVFGSPKNRLRGSRSLLDVQGEALDFFQSIGETAVRHGVRFCFEPNPVQYGADFGCTMDESASFVEAVNSPGFWLNFDAGAIALNGEDPRLAVHRAGKKIGHYHISEPYLGTFAMPLGNHEALAQELRTIDYQGVVSIEMKATERGLSAIEEAIHFARMVYPC